MCFMTQCCKLQSLAVELSQPLRRSWGKSYEFMWADFRWNCIDGPTIVSVESALPEIIRIQCVQLLSGVYTESLSLSLKLTTHLKFMFEYPGGWKSIAQITNGYEILGLILLSFPVSSPCVLLICQLSKGMSWNGLLFRGNFEIAYKMFFLQWYLSVVYSQNIPQSSKQSISDIIPGHLVDLLFYCPNSSWPCLLKELTDLWFV